MLGFLFPRLVSMLMANSLTWATNYPEAERK